MGFLKNLFKKKEGGTVFGNLLRVGSNIASGGTLGTGANRIEVGETKTNAEIAKMTTEQRQAYEASKGNTTFAGQPATISADGTVNMTNPLQPLTISAVKSDPNVSPIVEKLGETLKYLGGKTTEDVKVGADNRTLLIVGGGLAFLAVMMMVNKK